MLKEQESIYLKCQTMTDGSRLRIICQRRRAHISHIPATRVGRVARLVLVRLAIAMLGEMMNGNGEEAMVLRMMLHIGDHFHRLRNA